ncbi:uncharacterized protein [Rutidosis leptorrhynchoides]
MFSYEEFSRYKVPLTEVLKATNNFSDENLIGQGGFGKVYKGRLIRFGEQTVVIAARRLHYHYGQGDLEFWQEISMLSDLKHDNLVCFLGYCNENGENIIINKYENHESLDKYLKDSNLTWMQRLQICVGVARAMNYIHFDVGHNYSVIHRNIKSSKILLDENRKPKLSGFEHALKNTSDRRHRLLLSEVIGTIGYIDPTYEKTGFVTHKSDVYSFGVVLFEILCGTRAFVPENGKLDVDTQIYISKDNKSILASSTNNITTPEKLTTINYGLTQSSSFIDGRPSSFVDGRPSSFVDGGPSSFVDGRRSSFVYRQSSSFVYGQPYSVDDGKPWSHGDIHSEESDSMNEQIYILHPLYTMKKLEEYIHNPKEGLLAQLVKSCYDDESLKDMIDPTLLEQIDHESFKLYTETAYSCLKEQRAQRPNIDQVDRNLERALELQMRHENLLKEQSIIAGKDEGIRSSNRWKGTSMEHLKIPLSDILSATKNFTQIYLGSGTYGNVYGAELELPMVDQNRSEISKIRKTVAIKCLKEDKHAKQGFVAEIELLSSCKHPNIVTLVGFCDEGPHMILVYEYASNGSLDAYLGRTNKSINLTWALRLKICIDIARGLDYLHNRKEDEEKIIHRDIKSGNILLDMNLVAKIADFGLSRFHHANKEEKTVYTTNIAGTEVYLDPEYLKTGRLKRAVDIYSFGVVLFEILSGKIANDQIYMAENDKGIAHVARRQFEEGTINAMIDPKIIDEVDELRSTLNKGPNQDSLKTFIELAYRCVAETQDGRPTAKEIMEELEKALSLQENNKDNLQMSFEQIKFATDNFSHENLVGQGGFGKTYKGKVEHSINGCEIIVAKRLDRSLGQGNHHFLIELEILFDYKHDNIIGLKGYCNEMEEKIIVYEHASKMSLDMHLEDKDLSWMKRLNICIDVAKGLSFLHGGALTKAKEVVVHRDIKCANILLNADWKAKISDFGLSAITPINQEVISKLVGTEGYVDPLYEVTGFCTEKSDIYSFGVVLFEILYGKLLVPDTRNYNQENVTRILNHIHEEGIADSIVFKEIKEKLHPGSLSTFQMIVAECLDVDRKKRPTAEIVLEQLKKALELQ